MLTFTRYFFAFTALFSLSSVPADDTFQVTSLAPDILLLSADRGSYSNNSLVFTGPDGVLLVDTQDPDDAESLRKFVEDLGHGVPKYIISTHRHGEHIGGNTIFGAAPILITHKRFPEKLRSGTELFSEYPAEAFPDITFTESMEIVFNGELIRLHDIGGSHDDNEILVHFTRHGIAHASSVVNGFNFPSVDSDGDVLKFEELTRKLMALLPQDVRLVSGHHGQAKGYGVTGQWDQLPAYAEMLGNSIKIVRAELDAGKSLQDMVAGDVLEAYDSYAGSYVTKDAWIESVIDALTIVPETREDVFKPLYETWKQNGAEAAVSLYRSLLSTSKDRYDFSELVLLSIGSILQSRGKPEDALLFLRASTEVYPESDYGYYTHYLAALALHDLSHNEQAALELRESLRLNSSFQRAEDLLNELSELAADSPGRTGKYFGQQPPGLTPERFAPGFISTDDRYELNSVYSADGTEFFFSVSTTTPEEKAQGEYFYKVMFTRLENGHWTQPRRAPFSDVYMTTDIAFSPDSERLYFCTDRSSFDSSEGLDIWYVERDGNTWSNPIDVGPPVNSPGGETQPSFTRDGTLYFPSQREGSKGVDIYFAVPEGDSYAQPVKLGPAVNSLYNEGNSFVSPDGDYLLFARWGMPESLHGGKGLYISFKSDQGEWSEARHIEEETGMCGSLAALSPDGKYLFYSCGGDIFWVDARIVDSLRE